MLAEVKAMSKSLTLELPDDLWRAMEEAALREGRTPQAIALNWLAGQAPERDQPATPNEAEAARNHFRGHFGAVKSGNPRSADNEQIDTDLMRKDAGTHEVKS
jgi:UDP-N-acetylmuramyl tripeptide synthase